MGNKVRHKGTIVAKNEKHSLFKLFSGEIVTKQYLIKQIKKRT